jgi:hypothetical protein
VRHLRLNFEENWWKKSVKFPLCSFFIWNTNFIPERWEKSWKSRQGCIEASHCLKTLPTNPIQKCHFLQFSTFYFLLSYQLYYHEKILLNTKIKSGILVIEQKKKKFLSWTGNQKILQPGLHPTRIMKNRTTTFPKKIRQQIVVLCGTAYDPFLLYVKFTNWTKKKT